MHQPHRPRRRDVHGKPGDQPLHLLDLFGLRGAVLLRPALDLAGDVILAAAEIGKSDLGRLEAVQPRDGFVHGVIDGGALGRIGGRHIRLPEHAAIHVAHDVERGARHALVVAIKDRLGDRKTLCVHGADHAVFAVDRVRRRQQLARRLAPQHVSARRRLQIIGRVRLPALELLDRQRAGETFHLAGQISLEPRGIERQRRRDVLGAREGLLAVDIGH